MDLDDVILSDKERSEISEMLTRMRSNEPGLYVRQIGPLVLVHVRNALKLQRRRIKERVKKEELKLVKKTGGIAIFKETPRERR